MKIPLSLSADYCSSWGLWEATRELIANAMDTNNYRINIDHHRHSILIETYAGAIPNKYLLLGSGSKKHGDGTIGEHAEGCKLALLVLARENYELTVKNGRDSWATAMEWSDLFEQEHLHINIEENVYSDEVVRFEIHNLTDAELQEIEGNFLSEGNIGNYHQCDEGKILLDSKHVGQIYCGGIWVCNDSNLDYGYDFLPKHLSLDRDRQRVSTFDLQWITKEMWSQVTKSDDVNAVSLVADMVEKRSADTLYLNHHMPNPKVASELFKRYDEKYSGKVLAKTPQEVIELEASGITNAVFLGNELFTNIVKSSSEYKALTFETKISTVGELMNKFKEEWVGSMSRPMELDYEELTNKVIILAK